MSESQITKARGVVFDWDGVLLDSLGSSRRVYNKIFEKIGMRPLTSDEFLEYQSPNWYEFYVRVGVPQARWKEVDQEWVRLYKEERPSLYSDAMGCLDALKASGFRLAIVSNGSRPRIEAELERFGLGPRFESVFCGEKRDELKPSPAMLKRTLDELDLGPSAVVYVGDAPADIQAAKSVGVPSIALARGPIQEGRLRSEGPDYLFGGLGSMTDFLVGRMKS